MSTFLEIINEVLRRSGQETVTNLTNPETPVRQTMDFINDVYFEILEVAQCHFLETKSTFNTSNGAALYSLASDADVNFLIKDRIRETSSDDYLNEADPSMMMSSQLSSTGKPIRFWVEGAQMRM